jgi:hypothetical protein
LVFDGVLVIDKCDGDRDLPPAQTRICIKPGSDPDGPLRGTGLALVGAGAYTLDEIAERLDVIADVMTGKLPGDAAVLESAKYKLETWRQKLLDSLR